VVDYFEQTIDWFIDVGTWKRSDRLIGLVFTNFFFFSVITSLVMSHEKKKDRNEYQLKYSETKNKARSCILFASEVHSRNVVYFLDWQIIIHYSGYRSFSFIIDQIIPCSHDQMMMMMMTTFLLVFHILEIDLSSKQKNNIISSTFKFNLYFLWISPFHLNLNMFSNKSLRKTY